MDLQHGRKYVERIEIRLQLKPDKEPALKVDTTESIQVFKDGELVSTNWDGML